MFVNALNMALNSLWSKVTFFFFKKMDMADMLHEIYREFNPLGYAVCNKVYLEWLILYFTGNTVTSAL